MHSVPLTGWWNAIICIRRLVVFGKADSPLTPFQVIFAGSGPNRTIDHICQQSPLIEVFRSCHVIVESAFQLTHRTLKHTPPDMSTTIERLRLHMQSTSCCEFRKGRVVEREVMDYIMKGMQAVHAKKIVLPEEEAQEGDVLSEGFEAADLEAH